MVEISYRIGNIECGRMRVFHASLIAFTFGAAIRALPELLAGSSLVGNDTVLYAGLMANAISCLNGASLISYGNSPLLYLMLCPLGKTLSPLLIMKIAPVVLYGLLSGSLFYFITKTLKLPVAHSIFVAGFVIVQVATLRMSWDMHRTILSTSLLLILLADLQPQIDRLHATVALLLSGLVIASHELVGTLMLLIVAWLFLFRRSTYFKDGSRLMALLLPFFVAAGVWFYVAVSRIQAYASLLVNYSDLDSLAVVQWHYFSVLFLPLIPFALLSKRKSGVLFAWLGIAGLIAFSPLLPVPLAPGFWDRWMLMLVFPLGILAGIGVLRIPEIFRAHIPRLSGGLGHCLTGAILIAVVFPFAIVASGFMTAPSAHPFWLFDDPLLWNAGWSGVPSTMQSNTVDFRMIPDIQRSLDWLAGRMNSSEVLLTHEAFYGYALIYMPSTINVLWYGGYGVEWGLDRARAYGFKEAYLIWFTPRSGWHSPDPDLTGFKLVHQSGMIMLYVIPLIIK